MRSIPITFSVHLYCCHCAPAPPLLFATINPTRLIVFHAPLFLAWPTARSDLLYMYIADLVYLLTLIHIFFKRIYMAYLMPPHNQLIL